MNKKCALTEALNGELLIDRLDNVLSWNEEENSFYTNKSYAAVRYISKDGWFRYEPEPAKEEAPEYIDIEVWDDRGLSCLEYGLGDVIGKYIERHDTRYFATWYMIGDFLWKEPVKIIGDRPTFPSHVRFIREDLLGGIPK